MQFGLWQDSFSTVHEDCEMHFLLGPTSLGFTPYDPGAHPELGFQRNSTAYFCPVCGQVWGRILLLNSKKDAVSWSLTFVPCLAHGSGSFLDGFRAKGLLELLPQKALQREFKMEVERCSQ